MNIVGGAVNARRRGPSDELLCGCANMSREEFVAQMAKRPTASFDTILDVTGVGRECSACVLDLEYLFTESPRDVSLVQTNGDTARPPHQSLKRRLYAILDRVHVMMPYNRTNWMPVFYGGGVSEYLWMVNHQLLYDRLGSDAEFSIRYRLRDGGGSDSLPRASSAGERRQFSYRPFIEISFEPRVVGRLDRSRSFCKPSNGSRHHASADRNKLRQKRGQFAFPSGWSRPKKFHSHTLAA